MLSPWGGECRGKVIRFTMFTVNTFIDTTFEQNSKNEKASYAALTSSSVEFMLLSDVLNMRWQGVVQIIYSKHSATILLERNGSPKTLAVRTSLFVKMS